MEFSWGRKRNWECEEKTDSAKEVKEKEIKRKIQERLELWRKRELEERERQIREKEKFERKRGLEAGERGEPAVQELERKKNRIESQTDKNNESVRTKDVGIKELTADEVKYLRIGLSHDEVRGFIKDCTRLEKQGVELTEIHKAEVEKIKEEREDKVKNNELKFLEDGDDEINKIVREYEIKVEGQINELLVEAKDDFEKIKQKKEIWDKEAEETLNKIIEKSKTIDQRIKEHQIQDNNIIQESKEKPKVIDLDKFLKENKDIREIDSTYYCQGSGHRVKLPREFTENLCRFIGVMQGDGNLSSNRILITDKNLEYHKTILKLLFKDLFNLEFNIFYDRNRSSYYSHIKSSIVFRYLNQMLEFKPGAVRNSIFNEIPTYLSNLSPELKAHYIAGLYDAEGHVKKRQIEIDFSISSYPIWNFIQDYLSENKIKYTPLTRIREKRQSTYEIYIYGRDQVTKFCKLIPMKHPEKLNRIKRWLG